MSLRCTVLRGPHLAAATKKLKSYFRGEAANPRKGLQATRRNLIPRANRRWRMSDQVNRFLGDSFARTLIKLVVVSLIVGFVMTAFSLTRWNIIYGFRDFVLEIWHRGFSAL